MRTFFGAAFLAISLALSPSSCPASVWYVDQHSAGAVLNGRSWESAFHTVQAAMNSVQTLDEVWVAQGEYNENVVVKTSVVLYGGFAGIEVTREQRDPVLRPTILDGGGLGSVLTVGQLYAGVVIDGFTLRHGIGQGAAVNCGLYARLRIQRCVIAGNGTAGMQGSAIYAMGLHKCTIQDSAVSNNAGDGIVGWADQGFFVIRNTIAGNTGSGIVGGDAVSVGSNIFMNNGAATDSNGKPLNGGGIRGADVAMNNVFIGNRAASGAAAYGVHIFTNNTVVSNVGAPGGGAITSPTENARLVNNIVAYNTSGILAGNGPQVTGNCVYGNRDFNYQGLADPTGKNRNISVDPGLIDPLANPHLSRGSVCIDAGDDSPYKGNYYYADPPLMDVDGQPRVIGSHVDIGADEVETQPNGPRILYVSPYGKDTNTGASWAASKRTIQTAINALPARPSEVRVAAGMYSEALIVPWYVNLFGGLQYGVTDRDMRRSSDQITVVFAPASPATSKYYSSPYFATITVLPGAASTIEGLVVSGEKGNAIRCWAASPVIRRSTLAGCVIGLDVLDGAPLVEANTFIGNTTGALRAAFSEPTVISNAFAYNSSRNSQQGALSVQSSVCLAANNTFIGNTSPKGAIEVLSSTSAQIVNNILEGNGAGVVLGETNSPRAVLESNCAHSNTTDYVNLPDPTGTNGNIRVDPLLADPAANNFHIQRNSPCRDAGDTTFVRPHEVDIDGQARVLGPSVDIGADESDLRVWPPRPASVIRVSPSGNDANDGSTWNLAKRTIGNAVLSLAAGAGQVWISAGTYAGGFALPPNVSLYGGYPSRSVSPRSGRDPLANPTVITPSGVTIPMAGPSSVVDGLIIRGGGIVCGDGNPTISNNTITACDSSGITVSLGSPVIFHNTITGNGLKYADLKNGAGIVAWGSPLVANNVITNNHGGGVHILESTGAIIRDNLIWGNSLPASYGAGIGSWYATLTATNNTVAGNKGVGLLVYSGPNASVFANNIVANNAAGVSARGGTFRNNDFFGNSDANGNDYVGKTGNISRDPLFVNAVSGDYHLRRVSPCVDAGDDTVVMSTETDLDGLSRILGAHVDMGCYEFR